MHGRRLLQSVARRGRAGLPHLPAFDRDTGWLAPLVRVPPTHGRVPLRLVGAEIGAESEQMSKPARGGHTARSWSTQSLACDPPKTLEQRHQ